MLAVEPIGKARWQIDGTTPTNEILVWESGAVVVVVCIYQRAGERQAHVYKEKKVTRAVSLCLVTVMYYMDVFYIYAQGIISFLWSLPFFVLTNC